MRRRLSLVLAASFLAAVATPGLAQQQMERLTRGVVAVRKAEGPVFVSWRLLGTDGESIAFNVYRQSGDGDPVKVNAEPITGATNLVDDAAPNEGPLRYAVRAMAGGQELESSAPVEAWAQNYREIPIKPLDGYRPGDASVGDLDGDGELDIVLHQTSRGQDNSFAGVTGEPVLDAYQLDGTHLWRINLGKNIREGEHYTQFMVYDLDGDGRAEVACKTADGTTDGTGKVIGDAEKDWRTLEPRSRRNGRILDGPEFLTIFDGKTGAALQTVDYIPSRDPIDGWGGIGGNAGNDDYGNRCDRFLACVAYLDGERPSLVMCRGVYGRTVLAAWDWRDGRLTSRWVFDSGSSDPPFEDASPYSGMGGHSLGVADVDGDGKDEIVYQSMVVDDNGRGLYSTGLRHGDAMYVTDMYPDRPGMEVFTVHENEENAEKFNTPGAAMRDARTGEILWSHSPRVDIGGGMAADIDPTHPGFEAWGGPGGLRNEHGASIGPAPRDTGWTMWWDGDPLREIFSAGRSWGRRRFPTTISKWNWQAGRTDVVERLDGASFSRGACLVGDLLGDWREEVLIASPEGDALRLYTTTIPTELRLATLLHDPQYRVGLAWQNVAYNKPCYPSFYVGDGMQPPPPREIRVTGGGDAAGVAPTSAGNTRP
jgi:rhamnogalacturonan endolyase